MSRTSVTPDVARRLQVVASDAWQAGSGIPIDRIRKLFSPVQQPHLDDAMDRYRAAADRGNLAALVVPSQSGSSLHQRIMGFSLVETEVSGGPTARALKLAGRGLAMAVPIGGIQERLASKAYAVVRNVAVHPFYRGRGYGAQLAAMALDGSDSFQPATAYVWSENRWLLDQMGAHFEETGVRTIDTYFGPEYPVEEHRFVLGTVAQAVATLRSYRPTPPGA